MASRKERLPVLREVERAIPVQPPEDVRFLKGYLNIGSFSSLRHKKRE